MLQKKLLIILPRGAMQQGYKTQEDCLDMEIKQFHTYALLAACHGT